MAGDLQHPSHWPGAECRQFQITAADRYIRPTGKLIIANGQQTSVAAVSSRYIGGPCQQSCINHQLSVQAHATSCVTAHPVGTAATVQSMLHATRCPIRTWPLLSVHQLLPCNVTGLPTVCVASPYPNYTSAPPPCSPRQAHAQQIHCSCHWFTNTLRERARLSGRRDLLDTPNGGCWMAFCETIAASSTRQLVIILLEGYLHAHIRILVSTASLDIRLPAHSSGCRVQLTPRSTCIYFKKEQYWHRNHKEYCADPALAASAHLRIMRNIIRVPKGTCSLLYTNVLRQVDRHHACPARCPCWQACCGAPTCSAHTIGISMLVSGHVQCTSRTPA
jgi:hypothetical protein